MIEAACSAVWYICAVPGPRDQRALTVLALNLVGDGASTMRATLKLRDRWR